MINSRQKGMRGVQKAVRFAKATWPKAYVLVIYQPTRFSTPAPFDMIILDFDVPALLVEVRSGVNWGTNKPNTRLLTRLPGVVRKELWRFYGGSVPERRRWSGTAWMDSSWEADG